MLMTQILRILTLLDQALTIPCLSLPFTSVISLIAPMTSYSLHVIALETCLSPRL